jgi:hypothetical protein
MLFINSSFTHLFGTRGLQECCKSIVLQDCYKSMTRESWKCAYVRFLSAEGRAGEGAETRVERLRVYILISDCKHQGRSSTASSTYCKIVHASAHRALALFSLLSAHCSILSARSVCTPKPLVRSNVYSRWLRTRLARSASVSTVVKERYRSVTRGFWFVMVISLH